MAELVDALDSGSSGQYACGGSSPPFRRPLLLGFRRKSWLNLVLSLVFALPLVGSSACSPRGEAEIAEVGKHVGAMSRILEVHQEEPQRALEELEKYEAEHREALADLNHRVKDLRPQLTSAEKRELSARWKNEIEEFERKLEKLNASESTE